MGAMDPKAAALLSHVVSQIEANVNFLLEQGYISQQDASIITAKLPASSNLLSQQRTGPAARAVPPVAPKPAPPAVIVQARALWPYNENGEDPDDLSFSANDIIQVVEETNADWWTGKVHGKQALFPSAYVEKLPMPSSPELLYAEKSTARPVYRPFGAAHHGADLPPPAGGGEVNSVGLQQQGGGEEEGKKKSGLGKYKKTMAHGAAGGVGFGAGAAIGGGLVNAIF